MKNQKKFLLSLLIVLIISLILSIVFLIGIASTWQDKLTNVFYSEQKPLDNIIIISIDDRSLQKIGEWPWDRNNFTNLLNNLPKTQAIGFDISFFRETPEDEDFAQAIKESNNVILASEIIFPSQEILEPNTILKKAAYATGSVNLFTDPDGVIKTAPLKNSFAEKIIQKTLNKTYQGEKININFIGPPGTFNTISFSDALKDTSIFESKIVLIGASSKDLRDLYHVPTAKGLTMSGVEIHANIIQTAITKSFLNEIPKIITILTIFLISLVTSLILFKYNILKSAIFSFLILIIYIIIAIISFEKNYILNLVYPIFSIVFTYSSLASFYYVIEEKDRKRVTSIFSKYVSKDIAEELLKHKEGIPLEGIQKEITILFADIRNFTSLSEKLEPKKVVSILNFYLSKMTDSIFEFKGTVDKYIGDCIMALYNTPLEQKDHTLNAIKSALKMQDTIKKLNTNSDIPSLQFGIGINTGQATIGSMGSKERVDYTAIGDSVNLASRLCSSAKGNQILISESTYNLVKNKVKVKKLTPIKVKGKTKPIIIYEVEKLFP